MSSSILSKENVLNIAKLARLELTETDVEKYQKDLSEILSLAEEMNSCDTQNIEVMTHPMDAVLRFREDEVTEQNKRSDLQEIAPNSQQGLYLVPKVID